MPFLELIEEYSCLLEEYRAKRRSQGLILDTIFIGRQSQVIEIQRELQKQTRTVTGN